MTRRQALAVQTEQLIDADVLVQDMAPGTAALTGLGYAELNARHPLLASNAVRTTQRAALRALIVGAFAALNTADVLERLDTEAIANASINTVGDVWAHPQLHARNRFRSIDSPAGALLALLP